MLWMKLIKLISWRDSLPHRPPHPHIKKIEKLSQLAPPSTLEKSSRQYSLAYARHSCLKYALFQDTCVKKLFIELWLLLLFRTFVWIQWAECGLAEHFHRARGGVGGEGLCAVCCVVLCADGAVCCVVLCGAVWCCVLCAAVWWCVLCVVWCCVLSAAWCGAVWRGAPNYPQLPHFRSHCAHTPRHKISVSIFISHKISAKHAICAVEDTGVQREHPLKSAAAISICLTSFISQTMFSWCALDVKKCDLGTQSISSMYVVSINGPRYPKSVTVFAKNIFQKDGGEGHSTFGSVETVVRMTLFSSLNVL